MTRSRFSIRTGLTRGLTPRSPVAAGSVHHWNLGSEPNLAPSGHKLEFRAFATCAAKLESLLVGRAGPTRCRLLGVRCSVGDFSRDRGVYPFGGFGGDRTESHWIWWVLGQTNGSEQIVFPSPHVTSQPLK